jgi:hypothetical protein
VQIFEQIKSRWKEVIGQETRETLLTVSYLKREKITGAMQNYSLDDIFNAIANYKTARDNPEEFEIGSRIYGDLYGFLENGVGKFFTDGVVEANFRKKKNGGNDTKKR